MKRALLVIFSILWGTISFTLVLGYLLGIAINCKAGCSAPLDGFFQLGFFNILIFLTFGLPGLLPTLLFQSLMTLISLNSTPEIFPIFAIINSILSSIMVFLIIKGMLLLWKRFKRK